MTLESLLFTCKKTTLEIRQLIVVSFYVLLR